MENIQLVVNIQYLSIKKGVNAMRNLL